MAYTINLTNGTVFATINDGTTNTSSSMTLIGKNYAGYGQFLDDNFIHLLENSASPSSGGNPTASALSAPLTGQLWWDSTNGLMKVYNGSIWKVMTGSTSSGTIPSSSVIGDLWYDSTNQQLKVCSVAGTPGTFIVVGPAYSSSQGTSGAIPLTITDNSAVDHVVTGLYAGGTLVAVVNKDTAFIPNSSYSTTFPYVYKGVTVLNTGVQAGNIQASGNLTITAGGTTTVTVTSTGSNTSGYANVTGNIDGGNLRTAGLLTVTGNVTGGNLLTGGLISATGTITSAANITGGNILTGGIVSATGNLYAANFIGNVIPPSGANISTTGNVVAGNILYGSGVVSGTGNIYANNIFATNLVSATGNITSAANVAGTYFIGNGSQLTGLSLGVSVTKFVNGLTEGNIGAANANINFNVAGTSNVAVITTTGIITSGSISVNSGNAATAIVNLAGNAVGNIGSASGYFNTLYATATKALYADLAECFAADAVYEPGTVVEIGGANEITKVQQDLSEKVFGVISTSPAYTMNGGAGNLETHPPVALAGRVPVKVIGTINKGDRLVSAGNGQARAAQPGEATAFNVIGRALVDKTTPESGTIEAIVTIK
jgi:hypothetical protein